MIHLIEAYFIVKTFFTIVGILLPWRRIVAAYTPPKSEITWRAVYMLKFGFYLAAILALK